MVSHRRRCDKEGIPSGVCVSGVEAYHESFCASLDVRTVEGKAAFARANSRYVVFWEKVPTALQSLHRRQLASHAARQNSNCMHRYMHVKAPPLRMQDMAAVHKRELMRLYDKEVKEASLPTELRIASKTPRKKPFFFCEPCGVQTIRYRFELQCPQCHISEPMISSCDRNFKEFVGCETAAYVTYKRINHFNEWLLRTQGIEQRAVPKLVLNAVISRLRLSREPISATTPPKVAYQVVRSALSLSRYQDYFEHVPQIMKCVTSISPPELSDDQLMQIRAVFCAIQEPFGRLKPPKRRNFLSYSYIIYKVCELLEHDEVLPFCPLFKSVTNQRNADNIWKLICEDMGYEFIPTV
jgi:hypothetical protein